MMRWLALMGDEQFDVGGGEVVRLQRDGDGLRHLE